MCLLDYDFAILSNAFLIHRPGIKTKGKARAQNKGSIGNTKIQKIRKKKKDLVKHTIIPELERRHGTRTNCIA